MNRILLFLLVFFLSFDLHAQDFTGQWKGEFVDKSSSYGSWGGSRCDYVLELDCKGATVTGYSYTYFNDGGKKYYTICKLKGTVDQASKSVEVTEFERTKTNVPTYIRNCFQVHRLSYFQQGDQQTLQGTWVPAPKQDGNCGYGSTTLSRRILRADKSLYNNTAKIPVKPAPQKTVAKATTPKPASQKPSLPQISNTSKANKSAIVKNTPKATPVQPVTKDNGDKDLAKNKPPVRPVNDDANADKAPAKTNEVSNPANPTGFEKRNSTLLKTIEIENDKFTVSLYDNGEIDGDSISLFFNGKLLLSHKRLSDKPITLELNVDEKKDVNELIMYAENLGSIPPNTALMIVNDGDKRYEARIASDLEKSGVIRFIHKPQKGQ